MFLILNLGTFAELSGAFIFGRREPVVEDKYRLGFHAWPLVTGLA